MSQAMAEHLVSTEFMDIEHDSVRSFARDVIGDAQSDRDKASRLFAAVRDRIWYDPYTVSDNPASYRASYVLDAGRAYCVPKAVLLTAVCRAAGIPARLGFADVRNHLQTETLRALMGGSDLFVYHGYSSIFIDGRWLKATPAFNAELCDRFGVPPVDFDGHRDALLHAFTRDGEQHMEYILDRGVFDDLPLDAILAGLRQTYGPLMFDSQQQICDAFTEGSVDTPRTGVGHCAATSTTETS